LNEIIVFFKFSQLLTYLLIPQLPLEGFPVGKIAEKTVCRSVFLIIWHSIFSAELTKTDCFLAILPTGLFCKIRSAKN